MTTMNRMIRGAALSAFAVVALGQQPLSADNGTPLAPGETEQARILEQKALELTFDVDQYARAADLYLAAAELREGTAEAAHSYFMGGRLAYYAGKTRTAVRALTRSGEVAMEWGDVVPAARALAEAAMVAHERGDADDAVELASRAQRLVQSPLVGDADRNEIERRFEGTAVNP